MEKMAGNHSDNSSLTLLKIIHQAVASTGEGITIADAQKPDMPLIFANRAFHLLTGYTPDEVLGYNCRFLQGADTCPQAVQMIKDALVEGAECTVELLNYRKDGGPFWNRLTLVPIYARNDELQYFVGIQSDVTLAKDAEAAAQRLHALRATMETVNDIVLNFMSALLFFRHHMEDELAAESTILEQFDTLYNRTLDNLHRLNKLESYQEKTVAGVNLVSIQKD